MKSMTALLVTFGIIIAIFGIAFIASRFGKKEKEKFEKEKVLEATIGMSYLKVVLIMLVWIAICVGGIFYGMKLVPFFAENDLIFVIAFILFFIISIGSFVILPLVANKTASGKIKVDDNFAEWKIKSEIGKLDLNKPMSVQKGCFKKTVPIVAKSLSMFIPVSVFMLVYDIEQDGKKVSFYHDASLAEIKGLTETKPHGIYLHSHGRSIIQRILNKQKS